MKFIRDRGMTATKVIACLMALGVLASGCFGMANTGPHLVNQAVSTVGTLTVCPVLCSAVILTRMMLKCI